MHKPRTLKKPSTPDVQHNVKPDQSPGSPDPLCRCCHELHVESAWTKVNRRKDLSEWYRSDTCPACATSIMIGFALGLPGVTAWNGTQIAFAPNPAWEMDMDDLLDMIR